MDPVSHAASGAVAYMALKNRPATLWGLPLAALACASPDIDLCFIRTPLEFLQLHRGITHSFAGSIGLGLLLAMLAWPLWKKTTPERWSFWKAWLFCIGMILLHMWLDIVTTYGTMIFLPFSHYRVRLNAIFIVDLFITIPLLWAIWRWRTRRTLMLLALAWVFFYPSVGIVANLWHTSQWQSRLGNVAGATGKMVVLPDAFSPFFWRVIYEQATPAGLAVVDQSLNALGQPRAAPYSREAAAPELVNMISEDSIAGETYFQFALLPVMEKLRSEEEPSPPVPDSSLFMFYDLRFGSGLAFVRQLMEMRPDADMPFVLMAELVPCGDSEAQKVGRIRLRFSDSGRDSLWHRPLPPTQPTIWQWLVGLE